MNQATKVLYPRYIVSALARIADENVVLNRTGFVRESAARRFATDEQAKWSSLLFIVEVTR
jgi:hypothetical protein